MPRTPAGSLDPRGAVEGHGVADISSRRREERGTLEHDRLDQLARITVPTMVVVADDDTLVPPYLGETIAAAIPGVHLVRMREGGHNCFRTDPASFVLARSHAGWSAFVLQASW